VDAVTGMVMNLVELKQIMHKAVLEPLDHKVPCRAVPCVAFACLSDGVGAMMQNLDKDVEWFRDRVSTTENLAIYCWQRLTDLLSPPGAASPHSLPTSVSCVSCVLMMDLSASSCPSRHTQACCMKCESTRPKTTW